MKSSNFLSLLLNPFNRIAGWKAFWFGIIIVSITLFIGYLSDTSFWGVIEINIGRHLNLTDLFLFQLTSLSLIALFMFLAGILFAKNVRFQDVLGTSVLSRFPFIIAASLGFFTKNVDAESLFASAMNRTFDITNYTGLIIVSLLMIPICIWHIVLLYNAFKVSTGIKNLVLFAVIVLLSEIFSFVFLFLVFGYKFI